VKNGSQEPLYACIIFSKALLWGSFSLHNFRYGILFCYSYRITA
jgi:hypothetical protein